jgi:hypothetical protein
MDYLNAMGLHAAARLAACLAEDASMHAYGEIRYRGAVPRDARRHAPRFPLKP